MGIRYYAYPVSADLIEAARTSGRSFLGDDPLADAWGPEHERPPMLYLDKCWRDLQILFAADGTSLKRPAFALVEGNVTHTSTGWIAYTAVLDQMQVAEISRDLARISPEEVRSSVQSGSTSTLRDDLDKQIDYITHYLREALVFTSRLNESGDGLIYTIG